MPTESLLNFYYHQFIVVSQQPGVFKMFSISNLMWYNFYINLSLLSVILFEVINIKREQGTITLNMYDYFFIFVSYILLFRLIFYVEIFIN